MTFRFGHISDCHLGYRSGKLRHPLTGINLREQDGYDAFNKAIDEMIEQKVEAVICSGDIFHSPNPSIYTIVKCQEGLNKLAEANIPFYNIAGNHDATDNLRDVPSNRTLHVPKLNLFSYVEPYIVTEIAPNILAHFVSHHGFIEQQETMKNVKPVEGKFNILVTHGSAYDSFFNEILKTESSPREIIIPQELMEMNWDYTLMGHIHERGWIGSTDRVTDTENRKQFYGGSLIRRGFSDKYSPLGRGWTEWEIDNNKMTPIFHSIPERFQKDIIIYCENKTVKEIMNEIEFNFNLINFENNPILRLTFVDISSQQNIQIDLKNYAENISKCLTFTTKSKTKEELQKELNNYNFSFDLMTAYDEFWNIINNNFEKTIRKQVENTTKKLLKDAQVV